MILSAAMGSKMGTAPNVTWGGCFRESSIEVRSLGLLHRKEFGGMESEKKTELSFIRKIF